MNRREGDVIVEDLGVGGCRLLHLPVFHDARGSLSVAELDSGLPFTVARMFVIFDVPGLAERGGHRHRSQHQVLVAVAGSLVVELDDGNRRAPVRLDHPSRALHLMPGVTVVMRTFSPDARLLVLASGAYDPEEVIGDDCL